MRTPFSYFINKKLARYILSAAFAGLVLLHACTKKTEVNVAVPTITSVNKTTIAIGDTLVINGSQFSATPASDIVSIAATALKVIAASSTQLSAVIPAGTVSGQLTVALSEGRSATYDSTIQVKTANQPFITSYSPTSAYGGDTVVIRGGNFTTPANSLGAFISGTPCTIFNVSDSVIRMVVSDLAFSGPMVVAANGQTSLPVSFTVLKMDPLADGRIYWGIPVFGQVPALFGGYQQGVVGATIYKGADSSIKPPFATTALSTQTPDFNMSTDNGDIAYSILDNPIVKDPSGNLYYLTSSQTTVTSDYSTLYTFNLVKLALPSLTRSVLWTYSIDNDTVNYTSLYLDSAAYPYPYSIANLPQPVIGINGTQIYMKLGLSSTWLTTNVASNTPVTQTNAGPVADSMAFAVQFTSNYIFYRTPASTDGYEANEALLHYIPKGGGPEQTVPLDANHAFIQTVLADPSHGDQILIIAPNGPAVYGSTAYTTIYKFDPTTATLTKLYDQTNWSDAASYSTNTLQPNNIAYMWAGTHIYYANSLHSLTVNEQTTLTNVYNSLYRLDDDGSSTKVYTIYGELENSSALQASSQLYLFTGPK